MFSSPRRRSAAIAEDPAPVRPVRPVRRSFAGRAAMALALLYPPAIVATILLLRFVGERWWVTAVALYVPRVAFSAPLPLIVLFLLATGERRAAATELAAAIPPLLVLMGFVAPWPVRFDASKPVVRVLSFNINSTIGGIPGILAEIDAYAPDVVLLQEIAAPAALQPLLQARYPSVVVSSQFIMASRFPVTSTFEPENLSYYGRARWPRWIRQEIATPLGPIAFYDVHPISPREGFRALRGSGLEQELLSGQGLPREGEDVVKMNSGLRALQVESFTHAAALETVPVIIGGDTNLPNLSPLLHDNLSTYDDGFAVSGQGFGYTFPTGPTWRRPWMRIDRIFASRELRFVRFQVGRSRVSDHHCVVADLQRAH